MAHDAPRPPAPSSIAAQTRRRRRVLALAHPGRWLGRSLRLDRSPDATPARSLVRALSAALVVGVVAGVLELTVFLVQRDVLHKVSLQTLHWNRHLVWMIPVAEAVGVFLVAAVALTLGRLLPRRRRGPMYGTVLGTLLVLGPLLAIRGLYPQAAWLLALGLGHRIGTSRLWDRPRAAAVLRIAAPASIVALVGWTAFHFDRVAHAEAHAWARPVAPAPGTPNLLWIVLDTVRADRLSLHGYDRPTTPNLDRWAQRGVTFDQARSTAPWTLPSHVSMLSGLWPAEHGVRIDHPYTLDHPLIAEHLRGNGFATAGFVANVGCCNACFGFSRGFDRYVDHRRNLEVSAFTVAESSSLGRLLMWAGRRLGMLGPAPTGPGRKLAPEMLELAREWLGRKERMAPGRPFFLFVNVMDAHGPYRPPAGLERAFWTAPVPREVRQLNPGLGMAAVEALRSAPPAEAPARRAAVDAASRQLGDLYDDCLRGLDARLGAFLDELEARGTLDHTWVVITADHGEQFGEHDQFGHGSSLYDALVHVPLLLVPPLGDRSAPRGLRVDEPVSLRTLPATACDLLLPGTSHPYPGRSLTRAWDRPAPTAPEPVFAQLEAQPIDGEDAVDGASLRDMDAVIAEDRALIRTRAGRRIVEELYRLDQDPHQRTNRIGDPAEAAALARLRTQLDTLPTPARREETAR